MYVVLGSALLNQHPLEPQTMLYTFFHTGKRNGRQADG